MLACPRVPLENQGFWACKTGHLQKHHTPVMGTSGRGCSFRQDGTNTVMSVWPRSRNQVTASRMPRQENTSLFPWLGEGGTGQPTGPAPRSSPSAGLSPGSSVPGPVPTRPEWPDPALGLSPRFHLLKVGIHPGIWQHGLPAGGGSGPCNTPGGGEKVPGDFWFLPHPELLGPWDTDVHRQTESPPSLLVTRAVVGAGEEPARLTREKPDCSGLKFSRAHSLGLGPQRAQGRG